MEYQGKLKQNGISENLLKIIKDLLANRYQRVVLSGQTSGRAAVNSEISQGSILSLLVLVYMSDLSTGLSSNPRLFANYTLFYWLFVIEIHQQMNSIMICLR